MKSATVSADSDGLHAGARLLARIWGQNPVASSSALGWQDLTVCIWKVSAADYKVDDLPETLIALHTNGIVDRLGKGTAKPERSTCGRVSIFPAGTGGRFLAQGAIEMVTVHYSERHLMQLLPGDVLDRALRNCSPRFGIADRYTSLAIANLVEEVAAPSELGAGYARAVADAIALHLVRRSQKLRERGAVGKVLSEVTLKKIRELVDSNLTCTIRLDDMAMAAGLGRYDFAHRFRETTGISPYRFVTQRRVERAKDLLRETQRPIAQIALEVGYSSQARFSERFLGYYGMTPSEFRRKAG